MHDLIGDIHGYCSKLEALLTTLQYEKHNGVWKHAERQVIFVGDYIDRGPEIRETVRLVRGMTEAGAAIALMGNHEYNAIAYNTEISEGGHLRSHNSTHNKQHAETLRQFEGYADEWQSYLKWFYTLPLFLEREGLRAVHACWDQRHIDWLKEQNRNTLNEALLRASHVKGSEGYRVINETLKGSEFNIPEGYTWYDKDGHPRNDNRIKWWQDRSAPYGDLLFNCPPELAEEFLPEDVTVNVYPADAPPVFVGHYWLENPYPVIQSKNVVCLDYSIAKGGSLVAYRWNGEDELDAKNFVAVR